MKALLSLIFPTILLVGYGKSWDEQYEVWILDPVPYGGLSVLQQIKDAKDSGATHLWLTNKNITDLSPLAGLTNLDELWLDHNKLSDLSPLAGLTNLKNLILMYNKNIADLSPLTGLTNLKALMLSGNNISDPTPLTGLTNLKDLMLSGINISDSQKAMLKEALPNTEIIW